MVEVTVSIGIFSTGVLVVLPLLANAMSTVHLAQTKRSTAVVADDVIEQARAGETLPAEMDYTAEGKICATGDTVAYRALPQVMASSSPGLRRLLVQIIPVSAPERKATYAVWIAQP